MGCGQIILADDEEEFNAVMRLHFCGMAKPAGGMGLISAERYRRLVKGYDAAHDDKHTDDSLADLAAVLASTFIIQDEWIPLPEWATERLAYIKRKWGHDRIKILTISGALIAAEIDRLQRLSTVKERT